MSHLLRKLLARFSLSKPSFYEDAKTAIENTGKWEKIVEWRISTETVTRISRTELDDWGKYRVRVECDYVFEAHCPTLRRACEIALLYENLVVELWQAYGWPSWATRSRLERSEGDV